MYRINIILIGLTLTFVSCQTSAPTTPFEELTSSEPSDENDSLRVVWLGNQIHISMNYKPPHCTLGDEIELSFAQCEEVLRRYFENPKNPRADLIIGSSDKRTATDAKGESRFLKFVKKLAREKKIYVIFRPLPRGDISEELEIPKILDRLAKKVKESGKK